MIGILIVAHGTMGESLIHCASHVMGKRPPYLRQLGVTVHDDLDEILPQGRELVRFLDQGDGVLVMTDLFGATPSNIACKLLDPVRVKGVAGVNLPMLIRSLTYRDQAMSVLIEKALGGGCDGIVEMPAEGCV